MSPGGPQQLTGGGPQRGFPKRSMVGGSSHQQQSAVDHSISSASVVSAGFGAVGPVSHSRPVGGSAGNGPAAVVGSQAARTRRVGGPVPSTIIASQGTGSTAGVSGRIARSAAAVTTVGSSATNGNGRGRHTGSSGAHSSAPVASSAAPHGPVLTRVSSTGCRDVAADFGGWDSPPQAAARGDKVAHSQRAHKQQPVHQQGVRSRGLAGAYGNGGDTALALERVLTFLKEAGVSEQVTNSVSRELNTTTIATGEASGAATALPAAHCTPRVEGALTKLVLSLKASQLAAVDSASQSSTTTPSQTGYSPRGDGTAVKQISETLLDLLKRDEYLPRYEISQWFQAEVAPVIESHSGKTPQTPHLIQRPERRPPPFRNQGRSEQPLTGSSATAAVGCSTAGATGSSSHHQDANVDDPFSKLASNVLPADGHATATSNVAGSGFSGEPDKLHQFRRHTHTSTSIDLTTDGQPPSSEAAASTSFLPRRNSPVPTGSWASGSVRQQHLADFGHDHYHQSSNDQLPAAWNQIGAISGSIKILPAQIPSEGSAARISMSPSPHKSAFGVGASLNDGGLPVDHIPPPSSASAPPPPSERYIPKVTLPAGTEDWFDPKDEYRDDEDPGYRFRTLPREELDREIYLRTTGHPAADEIPYYPVFCAARVLPTIRSSSTSTGGGASRRDVSAGSRSGSPFSSRGGCGDAGSVAHSSRQVSASVDPHASGADIRAATLSDFLHTTSGSNPASLGGAGEEMCNASSRADTPFSSITVPGAQVNTAGSIEQTNKSFHPVSGGSHTRQTSSPSFPVTSGGSSSTASRYGGAPKAGSSVASPTFGGVRSEAATFPAEAARRAESPGFGAPTSAGTLVGASGGVGVGDRKQVDRYNALPSSHDSPSAPAAGEVDGEKGDSSTEAPTFGSTRPGGEENRTYVTAGVIEVPESTSNLPHAQRSDGNTAAAASTKVHAAAAESNHDFQHQYQQASQSDSFGAPSASPHAATSAALPASAAAAFWSPSNAAGGGDPTTRVAAERPSRRGSPNMAHPPTTKSRSAGPPHHSSRTSTREGDDSTTQPGVICRSGSDAKLDSQRKKSFFADDELENAISVEVGAAATSRLSGQSAATAISSAHVSGSGGTSGHTSGVAGAPGADGANVRRQSSTSFRSLSGGFDGPPSPFDAPSFNLPEGDLNSSRGRVLALPPALHYHADSEGTPEEARAARVRWNAEYAGGDLDRHREIKRKRREKMIQFVKFPPSSNARFPQVISGGAVLDCFNLKVIHERDKTGLEEYKEFDIQPDRMIAGRYRVELMLGQAAFSRAVQCYDTETKQRVCMKIIKNEKDFVDQSLDEIKLLRYITSNGDVARLRCVKLFDYFYYREHLIIVTELLKDNLYEFGRRHKAQHNDQSYFTMGRIQKIAEQVLVALRYIHGLRLLHCDLKPENILIKNEETAEVRVIDFGSSCFEDDKLSTYVQSRSYRAPEVLLQLPYDSKIDLWSLGCILAELWTGYVLFLNDSSESLFARIVGIIGPFPSYMMTRSALQHVKYRFTHDGQLTQALPNAPPMPTREPDHIRVLLPKKSSLKQRMRTNDTVFVDFLLQLLQIDPCKRPTAAQALQHPFFEPGRYSDGIQPQQLASTTGQ